MAAKKYILVFLITSLVVLVDLITKAIFYKKNFVVIDNILEIKYSENYGLVYGLFSNNYIFTILLPLVILVVLFYFLLYKENKSNIYLTSGFLFSGIIGNLISRVKDGFVTDFIYIPFLQPLFPNFNMADLSSFFSVIILIFFMIKEK